MHGVGENQTVDSLASFAKYFYICGKIFKLEIMLMVAEKLARDGNLFSMRLHIGRRTLRKKSNWATGKSFKSQEARYCAGILWLRMFLIYCILKSGV